MANKIDSKLVTNVYDRYVAICKTLCDVPTEKLDFIMDLECCNNAYLLDLDKLLKMADISFIHDIAGIMRNVDRTIDPDDMWAASPGSYNKGFVPRCAGILKLQG